MYRRVACCKSIYFLLSLFAAGACGGNDLVLPDPGVAAAIRTFRGVGQVAAPGTPLPDSIVVQVTDRNGDPVPGEVVAFTAVTPGAQVTPQTSITDSTGLASAFWVLGSATGTQEVLAQVVIAGAPTNLQVRFTASATTELPASSLVLRDQPSSSAIIGVPFDDQPSVQIREEGEDVNRGGVAVTAAVTSGPGSLAGTTTRLTDNNGRAEFSDLRIEGGTDRHVLVFAADGYTSVTSNPIEVRSASVINQPPVALGDEYKTIEGFEHTLNVSASEGVLQNDRDPEGGTLTAMNASDPPHGGVALVNDGSFSYTPEGGFFGDDRFTYQAADPTGKKSSATVIIHVKPVNDRPRFIAGDPRPVKPDAGSQTIRGWATGISTGAKNETDQVLQFHVIGNSNPDLFTPDGQPAATREGPQSTRGTLTFTPSGRTGTASITIVLKDNGGTANGGNDTSVPLIFTIRILR